MLPSDIAAIEKRANDASVGPWKMEYEWVEREGASYVVHGPSEAVVDIGYEEDAEFIAHARADIPELINALRAANDRAERRSAWVDATELAAVRVAALEDVLRGLTEATGRIDMRDDRTLSADLRWTLVDARARAIETLSAGRVLYQNTGDKQ